MTETPSPAPDEKTPDDAPSAVTDDAPPPPRPKRKRRMALVSVIISLTFALLAAEAWVRVFDVGPTFSVVFAANFQLSDNPLLEYELRPGSQDYKLTISSAGLRDREFPLQKEEGIYRIVVLGDSVTFGLYCNQTSTYAKHLEGMLNRYAPPGAPRFEVLNLGVTGYNTTQIAERLRVVGLPYEPDMVIYGYVINDPQFYSLEAQALRKMRDETRQSFQDAIKTGISRWLSHSRLFLLARYAFMPTPSDPDLVDEEPGLVALARGTHETYFSALHDDGPNWQQVQEGMAKMARITTAPKNIPVVVAIFPIQAKPHRPVYPFLKVNAKVAAEARRNRFRALDLQPAYAAVDRNFPNEFFDDPLHPNKWGHHIAALALFKWLCESGLLPAEGFTFQSAVTAENADAEPARVLANVDLTPPSIDADR